MDPAAPRDPVSNPCPDPEELARYMDGAVDETERDRIEAHLADCPDCREAAAVAARALRTLPEAATGRRPAAFRWPAAAAAAVLLAAVWVLSREGHPPEPAVQPPPTPVAAADRALPPLAGPGPEAVNTASGLELAGGFIAASNDSAVSSLCVQADGDTVRWALLRGSLSVELDPRSPPVRVVTPHVTVTIPRGEVRILVSPAQTDVVVAAGRANVEGAAGGEPLVLAKGQAAAAAAHRAPERAERAPADAAPAWVEAARARHLIDVMTSAFPSGPNGADRTDP